MGEPKWTPGPWRKGLIVFAYGEPDNEAYITSIEHEDFEVFVHGQRAHHDAHLIVAAQALYEALKPLAYCGQLRPPPDVPLEDWSKAVQAARDALRLARGEKP